VELGEYFTDIGLPSTSVVIAPQSIEFGGKTQNKGYYAVQGHSRSSKSVSIESIKARIRLPISD